MTETVRVLTVRERLLSVVAVGVLAAGSVGAATVEPTQMTTAARGPASPAPSPAASPATAPSPSPVPAPAPPSPAPKAAPAGPIPAPAEKPQAGCPVPKRPGGKRYVPKPLAPPVVAESALPAPVATAGKKAADLSAVSGKGVWVTNFAETPVDAPSLVARAKAAGLTNIWIRTGGKQGYYGDRFLPQLVPLAHAEGIAVVAWDFPYLSDPVADAARARRAFADGIDAFAPDVETSAEGTHATAARVALYLSLVRAYAGDKPIAATVPRPTPLRRKSFPYKAFVPYADLFAPMVYWSCHEPGKLVIQSLHELGAMLPVAPVGQAYDMGEEGGRPGTPTREETWRFLDVARRGGAVGASLWTIERMGPGQYDALRDYPWSPQE
jgi:hypothetical protein